MVRAPIPKPERIPNPKIIRAADPHAAAMDQWRTLQDFAAECSGGCTCDQCDRLRRAGEAYKDGDEAMRKVLLAIFTEPTADPPAPSCDS